MLLKILTLIFALLLLLKSVINSLKWRSNYGTYLLRDGLLFETRLFVLLVALRAVLLVDIRLFRDDLFLTVRLFATVLFLFATRLFGLCFLVLRFDFFVVFGLEIELLGFVPVILTFKFFNCTNSTLAFVL